MRSSTRGPSRKVSPEWHFMKKALRCGQVQEDKAISAKLDPSTRSPDVSTKTENLRREARVDVRVPVVIYRGKKPVALETADVSFKGLFVLTVAPPELRSLVRLKLEIFDREFEAHAMAVHIRAASVADDVRGEETSDARANDVCRAGVGLQFWGLSGSPRKGWDDFVRVLIHSRRAAA